MRLAVRPTAPVRTALGVAAGLAAGAAGGFVAGLLRGPRTEETAGTSSPIGPAPASDDAAARRREA